MLHAIFIGPSDHRKVTKTCAVDISDCLLRVDQPLNKKCEGWIMTKRKNKINLYCHSSANYSRADLKRYQSPGKESGYINKKYLCDLGTVPWVLFIKYAH